MLTDVEQEIGIVVQKHRPAVLKEIESAEKKLAKLYKQKEMLDALDAIGKTKGGADEDTISGVCISIVRENTPIAKADLEALTKEKLKELGYALTGVHKRLQKCLTSEQFTVGADDMVSLPKG